MSKNLIKINFFFLSLCLLIIGKATLVESQQQKPEEEIKLVQTVIPNRLFGLTIDESSIEDETYRARIIPQIETFKSQENQRPTVRIVLPVKNDVNEILLSILILLGKSTKKNQLI